MRAVSLIEPLEDRIAPASVAATVAPNGKSASYTDSNGDYVVVTTTKGKFTSSQFIFDPNTPGQLMELSLTGQKTFNGTNIAFTVTPAAGGSSMVNVGYIDAVGLSLGSVALPGDLGRIDAGGGSSPVALAKLTVNSLGVQGAATQGNNNDSSFTPSTVSNITGTLGTLNVTGNIDGSISLQDFNSRPGTGNAGQINIGGSLDGNTSTGAGEILFTGTLSKVVVGGGIEGGGSDFSGSFAGVYGEPSRIGSITVKGAVPDDPNPNPVTNVPGTSILGGSGRLTGSISAVNIGTVYIAGDIFGGTGTASGAVQAGNYLGKITVEGSLIGGNFTSGSPTEADSAGLIFGGNAGIGAVLIAGSIEGGSGLSSGELFSTATIHQATILGNVAGGSAGTSSSDGLAGTINASALGRVTVEGSLIGGNFVSGDSNQLGSDDGVILSSTTIGSVYIGQNVMGGTGPYSGMISSAGGKAGSVTVGGSMKTDPTYSSDGNVVGGSGASSGDISIDGAAGTVLLTHGLTGGSGSDSGLISVNGPVKSLSIGGNVTGGSADNTGTISTFGLLTKAYIEGSLTGSSSGAALLTNTGYLQADGIGALTLGGSLVSGTAGAGGLDTSGAIRSSVSIGTLTIDGNLDGNATNPAIISANGLARLTGAATSDVAMKTVTVKGYAYYGDILAGYGTDTQNGAQPLGTGGNADAQIGTVTIGGAFAGTNIIAGVGPGTSGFGTSGSHALSGAGVADLPTIISKISKVVIMGSITNTPDATATYGIAAQSIISATVDGTPVSLIPGPDNDTFAAGKEHVLGGAGGDVTLYEV